MTVQNPTCEVWSSFENLYFHAKSQLRGVCYPRLIVYFENYLFIQNHRLNTKMAITQMSLKLGT